MAETNAPPVEVLDEVAQQIRKRLVVADDNHNVIFSFKTLNERGSPATSTLDMGETFELWTLSPAAVDKFEAEGGDLAKLATRTGRFHHQITLDNGAAAFARSGYSAEDEGNGPLVVDEIYVSQRAVDLNEAIKVANLEFPEDTFLARLLSASAYQLEAIWFVNLDDAISKVETGGELLIVTSPSDYTSLAPLQRINAHDFLKALIGMPIGMGIIAGQRRE
jgi:hypothetical protein